MFESELSERNANLIENANEFRIVKSETRSGRLSQWQAELFAKNESSEFEVVITVRSWEFEDVDEMVNIWVKNHNVVEIENRSSF